MANTRRGCKPEPQKIPLSRGWLPWVHIAIGNLKAFLLGTFHGVTGTYLQEYLDEFVYRFNRRFREAGLPLRLLNACMDHRPVRLLAEKG